MSLLYRCSTVLTRNKQKFRAVIIPSASYADDTKKSNENDNKNVGEPETIKSETAEISEKQKLNEVKEKNKKRLAELLDKMNSHTTYKTVKAIQTAKPSGYQKILKQQKPSVKQHKTTNIKDAAKNVAKLLGDDTEKTETELLANVKGNPESVTDVKSLLSNMKVNRESDESNEIRKRRFQGSNLHQRFDDSERRKSNNSSDRHDISTTKYRGSVKLFEEQPLKLFSNLNELIDRPDQLKTWDKLNQNDLKLLTAQAPANYFEKMAYWTESGKIWHFPIDNEQGLDEEAQISFAEHIFLEEHLESWCPKSGPVHVFMELVCVGLSKNPYLTVQQKREHIEWYKNYFEEKKDILARVVQESAAKLHETKSIQ